MGMLLEDLYHCAENGSGTFAAAFPGEITQCKCRQMISYLVMNKIAVLLQAGLPEGTRIAHKHGWIIENDGLMHTIADAGLVYSPGGNYVISVYMYHPVQMLFDPANKMVAELIAGRLQLLSICLANSKFHPELPVASGFTKSPMNGAGFEPGYPVSSPAGRRFPAAAL